MAKRKASRAAISGAGKSVPAGRPGNGRAKPAFGLDELRLDGHTFSLLGIPRNVYTRLALQGAYHLLRDAKDPVDRWKRICSGNFTRKKRITYPLTVLAISHLSGEPPDQVMATWTQLSHTERRTFAKSPKIKQAAASIKAADSTVDLSLFHKPVG